MEDINLYTHVRQPLEEMDEDALRSELNAYRILWDWLPETVKYHMTRIGILCFAVGRDYKVREGVFMQPEFELVKIHLDIEEVINDYTRGKIFVVHKLSEIPLSNLVQLDFVADKIEVDKSELERANADVAQPEELPF